jgi:LPS O-antigen subunit length determinant protein (WzzB/FepE family)
MKKAEFDDLKQFMISLISQSEVRLESMIDKKLNKLESKMDDGFAGIAEVVENIIENTDAKFKNHEKRILKLEHKATH